MESYHASWSQEDQSKLLEAQDIEARLWFWADKLYGCSPYDLVPDGMSIDNMSPGDNWSQNFSENFLTFIMLPIFKDNIPMIHWCLEEAMNERLGIDSPSTRSLKTGKYAALETRLVDKFNLDDSGKKLVNKAIRRYLGHDYHPDFYFVMGIESAVKRKHGSNNDSALITRDLNSIIYAWDSWASDIDSDRIITHKTAKQYRDARKKSEFAGDFKKRRAEFLDQKKKWILNYRKLQWQQNQEWQQDQDEHQSQDDVPLQEEMEQEEMEQEEMNEQESDGLEELEEMDIPADEELVLREDEGLEHHQAARESIDDPFDLPSSLSRPNHGVESPILSGYGIEEPEAPYTEISRSPRTPKSTTSRPSTNRQRSNEDSLSPNTGRTFAEELRKLEEEIMDLRARFGKG